MLKLDENEVKESNFDNEYDPYGLIQRVFIEAHTSSDFAER